MAAFTSDTSLAMYASPIPASRRPTIVSSSPIEAIFMGYHQKFKLFLTRRVFFVFHAYIFLGSFSCDGVFSELYGFSRVFFCKFRKLRDFFFGLFCDLF